MTVFDSFKAGFRGVFRPNGRANRAEFATFTLAMVVTWALVLVGKLMYQRALWAVYWSNRGEQRSSNLEGLTDPLALATSTPLWKAATALNYAASWLGFLIPAMLFAILVRRFHDIGKSAYCVLAMYLLPILILFVPYTIWGVYVYFIPYDDPSEYGIGLAYAIIGLFLFMAAVLINCFIILWLCFKPSQPNTNPYGPNPTEASS